MQPVPISSRARARAESSAKPRLTTACRQNNGWLLLLLLHNTHGNIGAGPHPTPARQTDRHADRLADRQAGPPMFHPTSHPLCSHTAHPNTAEGRPSKPRQGAPLRPQQPPSTALQPLLPTNATTAPLQSLQRTALNEALDQQAGCCPVDGGGVGEGCLSGGEHGHVEWIGRVQVGCGMSLCILVRAHTIKLCSPLVVSCRLLLP